MLCRTMHMNNRPPAGFNHMSLFCAMLVRKEYFVTQTKALFTQINKIRARKEFTHNNSLKPFALEHLRPSLIGNKRYTDV